MITPDDTENAKGEPILFVRRWNQLVGALLIEPSVKLVAYTAVQYGLVDGEEVFPGNQRLARETGLSEKTVREAWHFLRGTGMAERAARSAWTGSRRTADSYELVIPGDWRGFPMLGPHAGRFTCQQCRKVFNPRPCNVFLTERGRPVADSDGDREVRWRLINAVFCPAPRRGAGCFARWKAAGGKWGDDAWDMFRKARQDDWP